MLPASIAKGERYGVSDARFGRLVLPWFHAMSAGGMFGRSCCGACWHGYRKAEVVGDETTVAVLADLGLEIVSDRQFPGVPGEEVPPLHLVGWAPGDGQRPGDPDPAALSRLVRDLVPGAQCSPNYLLRVASHPVLMPHFLPSDPGSRRRPDDRPRAAEGVLIGVLDTGCRQDHPWWGGRVTPDVENPPVGPGQIQLGHGTFVTGVLRRLAGGAQVVVRRVPVGHALTEWEVALGLLRLVFEDGVDVVNVSLGLCPVDDLLPLALPTAVRAAERREGGAPVIVAAAGNDGSTSPRFPAAYKSVVGVGAVRGGRPAPYTNSGWWVDACARGAWVSAYFGDPGTPFDMPELGRFEGFAFWEGTSFATPVVAARIASELADLRSGGDPAATPRRAAERVLAGGPTVPGLGTRVG